MKKMTCRLLLLLTLVLTSCAGKEETGATVDDVKLKGNQRIVIGQIKEIYGNEMLVAMAKEEVADEEASNAGREEGQERRQGGEAPQGEGFQRGAPQGEGFQGESSGMGERRRSRTSYTLTGEEANVTIPVGTAVTTTLGKTTTFSRLAANDMVKMVMETDEDGMETVVAIWIVGG